MALDEFGGVALDETPSNQSQTDEFGGKVIDEPSQHETPWAASRRLQRPGVTLPDGQIATVRSIGVGDDRGEWVIPTIVDSKPVSNAEAIDLWKSGKNEPIGGPFKTPEEANGWAQKFHEAEQLRTDPARAEKRKGYFDQLQLLREEPPAPVLVGSPKSVVAGVASAVGKTAANISKGAAQVYAYVPPFDPDFPPIDERAAQEREDWFQKRIEAGKDPLKKRALIQEHPLYQAGKVADEFYNELYDKYVPEKERETVAQQTGSAVAGLAPAMTGPLAPFLFGLSSAGEHFDADFDKARAEGKSEEEAASIAGENATLSGLKEVALWEFGPKALRKYIGDKITAKVGASTAAKWLIAHLKGAGELGALSGASKVGENVIEKEPPGKDVGTAVVSGALLGSAMPTGTSLNALRERTLRRISLGGEDVPVEPGPLGVIPEGGTVPVKRPRIRITLPKPENQGDQNATAQRTETPEGELPRVAPGENLPPNPDQVRQGEGEQANGGDRAQGSGNVPSETPPENVTPITFKTSKGSEYTVGAGGKTTRLKKSEGKGQGEVQEPMHAVYLTSEDNEKILNSGPGERVVLTQKQPDGTFKQLRPTIADSLDGATGLHVSLIDRATGEHVAAFPVETYPMVGLHPFEIVYQGDNKIYHLGNKIVEVNDTPPAKDNAVLTPVLKVGDQFLPGRTHADALKSAKGTDGEADAIIAAGDDANRMFRDQNGKIYSRKEAGELMKAQHPELKFDAEKGLQSQDLEAAGLLKHMDIAPWTEAQLRIPNGQEGWVTMFDILKWARTQPGFEEAHQKRLAEMEKEKGSKLNDAEASQAGEQIARAMAMANASPPREIAKVAAPPPEVPAPSGPSQKGFDFDSAPTPGLSEELLQSATTLSKEDFRKRIPSRITDYGKLSKEDFAIKSNEQQVLGMSASEKAARDATMLRNTPGLMDAFLPSEEGDVLAATNRGFLNAFVQGTGDTAELLNADNSYNGKVLGPRVKNAVLGAMLGSENRKLLDALIDRAGDLGIQKAVTGAMNAAPRLMKLRGTPYDLGATLSQAFTDLVSIKSEGGKLEDFLGTKPLFGDPLRTFETDFLLKQLAEAKSAKDIAEGLSKYADLAGKIDVTTDDIFGAKPTPRPDLLRQAFERPTGPTAEQADLTLGKPKPPSGEPPGPEQSGGTPAPVIPPKPAPAAGGAFLKPEDAARVEELKAALKAKLLNIDRNKLGSGNPLPPFDPEFFKLGGELAYIYLKSGVRKFADLAARIIADLGEKSKAYLLSWYNNARLNLPDIAHELDSEAAAQKTYAELFRTADAPGPDVSGGVGRGSSWRQRPSVRVAREELIPRPKQYVGVERYAERSNFRLDEEQLRGVNLILDWFHKVIDGGAFLLGDGPGFGKTAQELAVADMYSKLGLGKRVLIVTQNKAIAEGRFKKDAARMGIDHKQFTISTFTSLKNLPNKDWDLIIFDESHNLKNGEAQKSMAAARLKAKHKIFATATPMDKPSGAAYFLAEITGEDYLEVATKLGYTFQTRVDPYDSTKTLSIPTPLPGMNWQKIWNNIMLYRDAAVSAGAMIRREYPFFGKVGTHDLPMSFDAKMEQERITRHYDRLINQAASPTAKRNYSGQKTLTLSRWSEQQKLEDAVKMAVEHVKKGGQVVIVAETNKRQKFPVPIKDSVKGTDDKGRDAYYVDGAITKLKKLLAAAGITETADIHDPTSNKIGEEVEKFQTKKVKVALATPQSGGTGIDLDDTIGDAPRLAIVLSKNFAGDAFEQLVGRFSRKNTASEAEVRFLNLNNSYADARRDEVLDKKVRTLRAIQGGEELDVAGGLAAPQSPASLREEAPDRVDAAIAKLESLKVKPDTGEQMMSSLIPGLDPASFRAVWNGALDAGILALKAGRKIAEAVDAAIKYLHEQAAKVGATLDEKAARDQIEKDLIESSGPEPEKPKRHQTMGVKNLGEEYEPEQVFATQKAVRTRFFDGRRTIDPTATADFWEMAHQLTDPVQRKANADEVWNAVKAETKHRSADLAPGLLVVELQDYATRMAARGDVGALWFMVANADRFHVDVGGTASGAARTLRAMGETNTVLKSLKLLADAHAKAAGKALEIGPVLFDELMHELRSSRITPEEVDKAIQESEVSKRLQELLDSAPPDVTGAATAERARRYRQIHESNAERTALRYLDKYEQRGVEWLQPDKPKNAVVELIKNYLKSDLPIAASENARGAEARKLSLDLQSLGVSPATALPLARELITEREIHWGNRRVRKMIAAANSKSLRSLTEDILATPYRAQNDPAWRLKVAEDWFLSNGLSADQAKEAAKLYDDKFSAALDAAREKLARNLLEKEAAQMEKGGQKMVERVIKALSAGLLDPAHPMAAEWAARSGLRPLTNDQLTKLADLEVKLSDESLTIPERAAITEQMMGVFRHLNPQPGFMRSVAANLVATNLMGLRTWGINIFGPPVFSLWEKMLSSIARPGDFLSSWRTHIRSYRAWLSEQKFTMKHDAAASLNHELEGANNELKRIWEVGLREAKTGSPATRALAVVKLIFGSQQFGMRLFNAADQANYMAIREQQMALYSNTAFRDAGFGTKEINMLVEEAAAFKAAAYQDAIDRGLDQNAAIVAANSLMAEQMQSFISDRLGDSVADRIAKGAERDAMSVLGRRAKGLTERDEGGILSRLGFNAMMELATKLRSGEGTDPALSVYLLGYLNTSYRTMRFYAWNSPYGLFRLGIHNFREWRGKENWWKQSLATDLQYRHRLRMALASTAAQAAVLTAMGIGLANKTSADDEKKRVGVYFTGSGPRNKNLKDAWDRQGFKQGSMVIFLPGGRGPLVIPMSRIGEPLAHILWPMAARDDLAWRKKEALVSGRKFEESKGETFGMALGTYAMLLGQRGFGQNVAQMARVLAGQENPVRAISSQAGSVVAGATMPYLQTQRMLDGLFHGPATHDSVVSAATAAFPLLDVFNARNHQVNRFGDELYDRSFYSQVSKMGLVAFKVAETEENKKLYGMLVEKGVAPGQLTRANVEEKYGPLTEEKWNDFALKSGAKLKQAVLGNLDMIGSMSSEDAKKFLTHLSTQADAEAAMTIGLEKVKPTASIGGGKPEPAVSKPATAVTGKIGGLKRISAGSGSRSVAAAGVGQRGAGVRPRLRVSGAPMVATGRPARLISGRLRIRTSYGQGSARSGRPGRRRIRIGRSRKVMA